MSHTAEHEANSDKLRTIVKHDGIRVHHTQQGHHCEFFATATASDQLHRMGITTYEPADNPAALALSRDLSHYSRRVEIRDIRAKIGDVNWENTFGGIKELPRRTQNVDSFVGRA